MSDAPASATTATLPPPWGECFELAWESLTAGSVPVGAVIVDTGGEVVAKGRSRALETSGPPGVLWNTHLAHAEINALARLPAGRYPDHTLYTTLEPCLLCSSATVLAYVGAVRYAGSDPLWWGVERLPELNAHVARRWPDRRGPLDGPLAAFATLLPLMFSLRRFPFGPVAEIHEQTMPGVVLLARALLASGEADRLEAGSMDEALTRLWDRLEGVDPHPSAPSPDREERGRI